MESSSKPFAPDAEKRAQIHGLRILDGAINPPFPKTGGFKESRYTPPGYERYVVVVEKSFDPDTEKALVAALKSAEADGHVQYHNSNSPGHMGLGCGQYHVCLNNLADVKKLNAAIEAGRQEFPPGKSR